MSSRWRRLRSGRQRRDHALRPAGYTPSMGTVRGNMGTVLEHTLLSIVVDWISDQPTEGPLRYVDTHAMGPLNKPVGGRVQHPRAVTWFERHDEHTGCVRVHRGI